MSLLAFLISMDLGRQAWPSDDLGEHQRHLSVSTTATTVLLVPLDIGESVLTSKIETSALLALLDASVLT
jgi:Flp pilus assembly protein CpaB